MSTRRKFVLGTLGAAGAAGAVGAVGKGQAAFNGWVKIAASGSLPITPVFEGPTPEQISIYAPHGRTIASGTSVTVEYKVSGAAAWRRGHPLTRPNRSWIDTDGLPAGWVFKDNHAGVIFDLQPGTTYDVRLTVAEPGQPTVSATYSTATRALPPSLPATPNYRTATTATKLNSVFATLNPGDVLTLADGVYTQSDLFITRSGTPTNPIIIRGTTRTGTIIRFKGTGAPPVLSYTGTSQPPVIRLGSNVHDVVFERMTVDAPAYWVLVDGVWQDFSSTFGSNKVGNQQYITFRNLKLISTKRSINSELLSAYFLVYDCEFLGSAPWSPVGLDSNSSWWNSHAIRISGVGHCVFNNTFSGHGDVFRHTDGLETSSNFFYRNKVIDCPDDVVEFDSTMRNNAMYDNDCSNIANIMSIDTMGPGPAYCFRNTIRNAAKDPYKLTNWAQNFLIYNNTVVRTKGYRGYGWYSASSGGVQQANWAYRNNILIHRSAESVLDLNTNVHNPIDFDHNAWFEDSTRYFEFENTYGGYGLAAARAAQPPTLPVFGDATRRLQYDIGIPSNPFVTDVTLGADWKTRCVDEHALVLSPTSAARNAGVAITGITDGYSGAAPDIGAVISGRQVPVVGDRSNRHVNNLPSWVPTTMFQWTDIPGSAFDYTGWPSQSGDPLSSNYRSTWAFSGPAYSRKHHEFWLFGGGHASSYINTVGKLRLSDPVGWELVHPGTDVPTRNADHFAATAAYNANPATYKAPSYHSTSAQSPHPVPCAPHAYRSNVYLDSVDTFVAVGLCAHTNGLGDSPEIAALPRGATRWEPPGTWGAIPIPGPWDQNGGINKFCMLSHDRASVYFANKNTPLFRLQSDKTQQTIAPPSINYHHTRGAAESATRALVVGSEAGASSGWRLRFLDLTTGAVKPITTSGPAFPTTPPPPLGLAGDYYHYFGVVYVPETGTYYAVLNAWIAADAAQTGPQTPCVLVSIKPTGANTADVAIVATTGVTPRLVYGSVSNGFDYDPIYKCLLLAVDPRAGRAMQAIRVVA